jgi:hypothetical protein
MMFNQILCVLYNWKQNLSSNGRHRIEGMYGEKLRRPGTKRKIPSIDRNLQPTRLQESERFWGECVGNHLKKKKRIQTP